MISLDVTALFTNVPLQFVIQQLSKKAEGIFTPPIPIQPFLKLIELCVDSTVFTFDGKGFKQKFGVAMGSPLSPVLANLCMEFIESEYISSCPDDIKPLLWFRYVDDIFIFYQTDLACFDRFLNLSIILSLRLNSQQSLNKITDFLSLMFLSTIVQLLCSFHLKFIENPQIQKCTSIIFLIITPRSSPTSLAIL